jgi:hypothetical protein
MRRPSSISSITSATAFAWPRLLHSACPSRSARMRNCVSLAEMLLNLKKHYQAAWYGGDALTKRLIMSPAKTSREIKDAYSSPPAENQP